MENLFEILQGVNIVGRIEREIEAGAMELTEESKIKVRVKRHAVRPWQLFYAKPERDCLRWNHIYCKYYGIVPRGCMHCWKVVFKARDLAELFKLLSIQKEMGLEAKCGVDRRMEFGGFGQCVGFWYAPLSGGLRAGRNLFRIVKEHLEKELGRKDLQILLKRGCTEMEAMLPSDKWDSYAEPFGAIEQKLDQVFEIEPRERNELELSVYNTHQHWIKWRAELGDMSYLAFTGGQRFWPAPVEYQESEHLEEDHPGFGKPLLEVVR